MTKKNLLKLISVVCILIVLSFTLGISQSKQIHAKDEPLEKRFEKLKNSFDKLRDRLPQVAFINTDEVVTAFQEIVSEERNQANQVQQDYLDLQKKYNKGEIGKSQFNIKQDVLRAKLIKTRIMVYYGMIEEMIRAPGFQDIAEKLREVEKQVDPTLSKLNNLVDGIPKGEVSPQNVTKNLEQGQKQLQQFENLVMNLIRQRIFSIAGNLAKDRGYDLVLKQGNIIFRKEEGEIKDITSAVKERVNREFNNN